MIDIKQVHDNIMNPLMIYYKNINADKHCDKRRLFIDMLSKNLITHCDVREVENYQDVFAVILFGDALVLLDNNKKALVLCVKGFEKRNVDEPVMDLLFRAPQIRSTNWILISEKDINQFKILNAFCPLHQVTSKHIIGIINKKFL